MLCAELGMTGAVKMLFEPNFQQHRTDTTKQITSLTPLLYRIPSKHSDKSRMSTTQEFESREAVTTVIHGGSSTGMSAI